MANKGQTHAVLENIDYTFGRSKAKTKEGFNYNRLLRVMHLPLIKQEFDHIGRKYNIAVSFVNPAFTSQECSKCGYIHPGNRLTQENFVCLDCGHTNNADSNASDVIRSRVSKAVLRCLLSAETVNGAFRPKNLSVKQVRTTLDYLRNSRIINSIQNHQNVSNYVLVDSL